MGVSLRIYDLLQQSKYHDALNLAEQEFLSEETLEAIVEYVRILIYLDYLEKAELVLANYSLKAHQHLSIFYLHHDLYIKKGDGEKLKELAKVMPHLESAHDFLPPVQCDEQIRNGLDYTYFRNQLLQVIKNWASKYKSEEKIFKKIYIILSASSFFETKTQVLDLIQQFKNPLIRKVIYGDICLLEGRYDEARKLFLQLLPDFNDKAILNDRLGDIALAQKKYQIAIVYYRKAIALNPEEPDYYLNLIEALVSNKESGKAKNLYLEASEKHVLNTKQLRLAKRLIEEEKNFFKINQFWGLCWYNGGGSIFGIEVEASDGLGKLNITGKIGSAMLDSINVAYRVAQNFYAVIKSEKADKDIHINIPKSIIYKDGPSAGLTFTMGILSTLLGLTIPSRTAFSGEISLSGNILPVGGINGKVTAAYYNNINVIYLPNENYQDVVTSKLRPGSQVRIRFVKHINQVVYDLWKITI